jgi:hypothetical protein
MPEKEFKLFFNDKPVTKEQFERVEDITVEQNVDMVWEARLRILIYSDDTGIWSGENEDLMSPFSRIRVELKNGKGLYVPLIDGVVSGFHSKMMSKPGESELTIIVHDNSILLNRIESIERFEKLLDSEIAKELFNNGGYNTILDVESTPIQPGSLPAVVIRRGTAMQLLRFLARRNGMHAYVLPTENPGQSKSCFKSFPTETDGLPPLTLLGNERSLESFNVRYHAEMPSMVKASTIGFTDKAIRSTKSKFANIDLLGKEKTYDKESETAGILLPPYQGESVDLDQAVSAQAGISSFAFEASGSVLDCSYQGILQPYRVVSILGINGRMSGNYLITEVTHAITRFTHSQSFTAIRNARSAGSGSKNNENLNRRLY